MSEFYETAAHILPETSSDDRAHTLDDRCWCRPTIDTEAWQIQHKPAPDDQPTAPGETCGRCGTNPARGFATIGTTRYCHGDAWEGDDLLDEPTCYMRQSWDNSSAAGLNTFTLPERKPPTAPDTGTDETVALSCRDGEHDEWCPKNGCRCGKCPCWSESDDEPGVAVVRPVPCDPAPDVITLTRTQHATELREAAVETARATIRELLRAIAQDRYRYERVHVEADLNYLRSLLEPTPDEEQRNANCDHNARVLTDHVTAERDRIITKLDDDNRIYDLLAHHGTEDRADLITDIAAILREDT